MAAGKGPKGRDGFLVRAMGIIEEWADRHNIQSTVPHISNSEQRELAELMWDLWQSAGKNGGQDTIANRSGGVADAQWSMLRTSCEIAHSALRLLLKSELWEEIRSSGRTPHWEQSLVYAERRVANALQETD